MKNLILIAMLLTATSFITACGDKTNPRLQVPAEKFTPIQLQAGETKSISEPKVNILFVVDNSGSMKGHQATLQRNINLFADKFFNNPRIDYKIGVVPVYDRVYPRKDLLHDPVQGQRERNRKMNPLGELVPLKDRNGQVIDGAPYITRETQDAKNVLKNTVALGVQWGPEAEESFSPVMKIIADEKHNQTVNAGFYDKDAYLVVIFLTDADDVTPEVTGETFYNFLVNAKGGDKNKILIAAALPSATQNSAQCAVDGNGPQYAFPELIRVSGALRLDLCSNTFGAKLAEFGQKLVQRVATQVIELGFTPDITKLSITYGTQDQPESERQVIPRTDSGVGGYSFNPKTNRIFINPNLNITRVEGGEIFISATPVNMSNISNGRAKPNIIPQNTAAPAQKQ